MNNIKEFLSSSGILSGVVAGLIAACVQVLITYLEHFFKVKDKRIEQTNIMVYSQIEEIDKLIYDVSNIRVPSSTEINEDIIENAYYLIDADFQRAKSFLVYRKDHYYVKITSYFRLLNYRYDQMQAIKLGQEKELNLADSQKTLVGEIKVCKEKLLKELQNKKSDLMSDIS